MVELEDAEAVEQSHASLNLTLSKPREVKWAKGDEAIKCDDVKIKSYISESGLEHKLFFNDLDLEDGGMYTAHVEDDSYGTLTSSCTLSVKGIHLFH